MDIAILIHGKREGGPVRNSLLRPFASSSLLEIALEKLSTLDAPCKKYVAIADRETKQITSQFSGLTTVRCDAPDGASHPLSSEFEYLARLPESWFFIANPLFPLVSAEQWWEAVEGFLADEPKNWVSASRVEGVFYNDDGSPCGDGATAQTLLQVNDAFKIVSKASILQHSSFTVPHAAAPEPFVLPSMACWGIQEMDQLTAVEAVYSMSQLGIFA